MPISCISTATISLPTTAAALFRITAERKSPMHTTAISRYQVDGEARQDEQQAVPGGHVDIALLQGPVAPRARATRTSRRSTAR
jgi:hypothetical protein